MSGHYTLIIRNEKKRIIQKIEYNDRYYSGTAMMDFVRGWKIHYKDKNYTFEW